MKKLKRTLSTISAGTYLATLIGVIGTIDIELAKENKISLENVSKNCLNSIYNPLYTLARSFVGLAGKDILTGEEIHTVLRRIDCAFGYVVEGMVDQMFYTFGIVIPYKTKNVGEKRNLDEGVIEIPS